MHYHLRAEFGNDDSTVSTCIEFIFPRWVCDSRESIVRTVNGVLYARWIRLEYFVR